MFIVHFLVNAGTPDNPDYHSNGFFIVKADSLESARNKAISLTELKPGEVAFVAPYEDNKNHATPKKIH